MARPKYMYYADGTPKKAGYNKDGTKRKSRRTLPWGIDRKLRIQWRGDKAYVYDSANKYVSTYEVYRGKHKGGRYTDMYAGKTKISAALLTKKKIAYLHKIDSDNK